MNEEVTNDAFPPAPDELKAAGVVLLAVWMLGVSRKLKAQNKLMFQLASGMAQTNYNIGFLTSLVVRDKG